MLDSNQQQNASADYLFDMIKRGAISVHMQHTATRVHDEITYDPTDDGPEVNVIRAVNGTRWR